MNISARSVCATTLLAVTFPIFAACSDDTGTPAATGGTPSHTGGTTGGTTPTTGGTNPTGGTVSTGGSTGGAVTGGSSTGGTSTGGATGGASTGGTATGGAATGGSSGGTSGAASGGASGSGGGSGGAAGGAGGGIGGAGGGAGGAAGGGGGGRAGGAGGASGGAGGGVAGGAGGVTCGTLTTATDGSYVRTGWSGEYTCTGGSCPPKGSADTGDVDTKAFDGNYQTRWSTGVYQSALKTQNKFPLFFTVDMKVAAPISKLTTHPGCQDIYDSPGTIEVQVSTDGTTYTTITTPPHTVPPITTNEACPPSATAVSIDTITFPTTCARYIRLKATQRTNTDRYWAIGEMRVYP